MKFSINQQELQSVIDIASRGVSNRITLAVLSGLYIKAENNIITIESTDLNLSIRCRVNALVEEEGTVVIPCKLFSDVIKSLPDETVHIQADDESATILCGASSFNLKVFEAIDFPGFPDLKVEDTLTVPFQKFSSMVKCVAHAASKDETRAIMTGVYLSASEGTFAAVATDSYRLALSEYTLEENTTAEFSAVINATFLKDVASLSASSPTITLGLTENQIVIEYGNTTFVNRRIEGTYPDYKRFFPESFDTKATYKTEELMKSVKRTSLLATRTESLQMDINAATSTTQLSAGSQDIGSASETIASTVEGNDAVIRLKYLFVIDGLASVHTENVELDIQGPGKPGIFSAVGEENYRYLVMPLNIH